MDPMLKKRGGMAAWQQGEYVKYMYQNDIQIKMYEKWYSFMISLNTWSKTYSNLHH